MMKKIALALLIALTLCPVASFAQVAIRIGPPHRVYEDRGRPPERGYVWTGGYHRYDGDHYVWTPGRWQRPEHPGQRWVAHRWRHRGDHYEMEEGHWR
jgi:hypothetical protein